MKSHLFEVQALGLSSSACVSVCVRLYVCVSASAWARLHLHLSVLVREIFFPSLLAQANATKTHGIYGAENKLFKKCDPF